MGRKRILVADDEQDIIELITYNLTREGFEVISAGDGRRALEAIRKERPSLVVLDIMMPELSGLEVCRLARANPETAKVPIIMLTAKTDPIDRILGLEIGADDYLTKPFHVRELLARIKAVLRRAELAREETDAPLSLGGLTIDPAGQRVTRDGRPIELSSREFRLLQFLASRPGRVYSREQLLDHLWGDEVFVEPRTVDVHISRLRAAVEPDPANPRYIITVRGSGYKFADQD